VDKEAVDAMAKAVKAAPSVWDTMSTILIDMPKEQEEVTQSLSKAQTVTRQLKERVLALQEGNQVDRKSVRDDAHVFIKARPVLFDFARYRS